MGGQHRLTRKKPTPVGPNGWLLSCSCCLLSLQLLAAGCGPTEVDKHAELRRQLLRGEDLQKQQSVRLEKERLTAFDGDLLPSDTRVAGIVMPRGFQEKFKFDYEWYYDGPLPFRKLDKYFRQQLDYEAIARPDPASVVFSQAKQKGVPDMKGVTVKIYPLPGRSDWSRIFVRAPKPLPEHVPTKEEVSAMLQARHAHNE